MQNTTISDIDIPFGRLVAIILKFMLASIPAVILLYIIIGLITVLMMALFGGAFALLAPESAEFTLPDGTRLPKP